MFERRLGRGSEVSLSSAAAVRNSSREKIFRECGDVKKSSCKRHPNTSHQKQNQWNKGEHAAIYQHHVSIVPPSYHPVVTLRHLRANLLRIELHTRPVQAHGQRHRQAPVPSSTFVSCSWPMSSGWTAALLPVFGSSSTHKSSLSPSRLVLNPHATSRHLTNNLPSSSFFTRSIRFVVVGTPPLLASHHPTMRTRPSPTF